MSEEVLQITIERREEKSKGEKEWYFQLNAEFKRKARREKKVFLNEQCKEMAENDSMGKARDLFKKIRDIKGAFHAGMGKIKDRKNKDLTEAEELRSYKNTQKSCT